MYIYVCIYIYVYMYICIYVHIYIQSTYIDNKISRAFVTSSSMA